MSSQKETSGEVVVTDKVGVILGAWIHFQGESQYNLLFLECFLANWWVYTTPLNSHLNKTVQHAVF